MSPSDTRTRLTTVLEPVVRAAGYDLEEVEVGVAGRRTVVRVFIDRLGGFTLDDVADVSRALSATLDANDHLVPGAYVLEVSSPGVDRPLTAPRHWLRNVGRLVRAQLDNGDEITGRVLSAADASAVLDVDGAERDLPYADVLRAQVQIEVRRPTAEAGLDDTDDEQDTDDLELDDMGDADDMDEISDDETSDDEISDDEISDDIELDEELEGDDLNLEDLELEPDVNLASVDEDFDVETDDETGPADDSGAATGAGER